MKTYNNLFGKIVDIDNIKHAIVKAAKGKRKKQSVRRALNTLSETALRLSEDLKNHTWTPVKVHQTKEINDGVELKKRFIVCPHFVREQCVHHAIMNICEPLFRKKFYNYSCGSVKGHGAEQAKDYIAKMIRKAKKVKYVAKLDIQKFFHNARPSFIFSEIRKTIRDKEVLRLFALILRSNVQVINRQKIKQGIPIGFFTSPHFANILLNPIDHIVKEELGADVYVRYMDDMILFSSNKRKLKRICKVISEKISELCMSLKPIWQIQRFESVNFLGYQFKNDGRVRLRDRIFIKAVRLVKRARVKVKLTIHDCLRIISYMGRFRNAQTFTVFEKTVKPFFTIREIRSRISRFYKRLSKLTRKGLEYVME